MMASRGRARFGVLVPFTNTNLEPDLTLLRPSGVSLHFTRMGGYDQDKIPDEEQMQGLGAADLDDPLHLLQGVRPDVVVYGCTSATLTHGMAFDRQLAVRIKAACGAETVTAAGALANALSFLSSRRVGFASPYVPTINDMAVSFLADAGVQVVNRSEVTAELDNYGQGDLCPDQVFDLGHRADCTEAEAIVLSCTDMRSVETISKLEQAIGKPVITSNQAMIFQAMQLAQMAEPIPGFGHLLEKARL